MLEKSTSIEREISCNKRIVATPSLKALLYRTSKNVRRKS